MSTDATPENPGLFNWLLILGLGVVWGAAFMAISISLDGFTALQVTAGRIVIGAAVLCCIGIAVGQPLSAITQHGGRRGWIYVIFIGLVSMALPLTLLSWGQQFVPSAFAGITMGAVPLLILPLVFVFSPDEGIGPRRVFGVALGFVGLALLVGPGAFSDAEGDMAFWGQLACIGTTCCYAVGSVATRRAPKMPPVAMASGTLVVASCVILPPLLLIDGLPSEYPAGPTMALGYAAVFTTALAMIIRMHVISTAGSVFMSLTSYMVPVWSVIFGVWLLSEELPAQIYLALGLILMGIFIAQSRQIVAAFTR